MRLCVVVSGAGAGGGCKTMPHLVSRRVSDAATGMCALPSSLLFRLIIKHEFDNEFDKTGATLPGYSTLD
eukprot:scaffold1031_cov66-Phaeocystis_antarctica.AAC.2